MQLISPRIEERNNSARPMGMSRLVGALGFGLVAGCCLWVMRAEIPYELRGAFVLPCVVVGALWLGWWRIGAAGAAWRGVVRRGIGAAVLLAVWILCVAGVLGMIRRAMHGIYRDPGVALTDIVTIGVNLAPAFLSPVIIATLFMGALLSSIVAEWVGRRWH